MLCHHHCRVANTSNGAAVGCALMQAASDDYNRDDHNDGGSANGATSDGDNATSTTKATAMGMATVAMTTSMGR